MFSTVKLGLYAAIGATVAGLFVATYLKGSSDGKASVRAKLAADKVKILKDGQEIDAEVFAADDEGLCALLGGCAPDGVRDQTSGN